MATVEVRIPQMGEGLHEVQIISFDKAPGDTIQRDEPIYSMETDKAVMEVESPYEGVLTEWLAQEGDILAIGAPIARIETSDAPVEETTAPSGNGASPAAQTVDRAPAPEALSFAQVPPRTRAYCKEKGLSDDEIRRIPAAGAGGKLMPADVDAYLEKKAAGEPVPEPGSAETPEDYVDRPLSRHHRTFIYRLKRSAQLVVPAVAKRRMEWGTIRGHAAALRAKGLEVQPSSFQTFAYCVVQAIAEHPRFRSALIGEDQIREYTHVNIGIAVGTSDGELMTAVVHEADRLDFETFVRTAQENIRRAREGEDQADETVQFLLSYMGPYDIVDAVPVLVAPAAAILFVGSSFDLNGAQMVNLVLTIDHRLIQGIEAAEFLKTVVEKAAQVEQLTLGG